MATSFFDLVRTGAASFDAPGFAAEEVSQLVHAAMDLMPPTTLADLVADRPFLDDHEPGGSWADLVAGHDVCVGAPHGGPLDDGGPFDFGAGTAHRPTMFDGPGSTPDGGHGAVVGHDVHGTTDGRWPHGDLFDDGDEHGPSHGWAPVDHEAHDDPGHDHPGLHDSVLHEGGLRDHHGHELHPDPAEDGPHSEGGWHAE